MRPINFSNTITQTDLSHPIYRRGKVRDTYDLGDRLLMVSTDRISAFDVVLPTGIPYKGEVLNTLSLWWFDKTKGIMPNHLVRQVDERSVLVDRAYVLPIEWVVRGYLYGSLWADYKAGNDSYGLKLPAGMKEADKLPRPILTPTTKALTGHDEALLPEQAAEMVGRTLYRQVESKLLELYQFAEEEAAHRGIIIADTKFEVGLLEDLPILVDELLTPDSSRFWPMDQYEPGRSQPSYDKQYVRDWLDRDVGWNKEPPAPPLPPTIVINTSQIYQEAYERLIGNVF